MNSQEIRENADYQKFAFTEDGKLTDIGDRMAAKLDAFGDMIPDLAGKSVLDVGTDFGFWAFLASERAADKVLGLDRNRSVRGLGVVDLVTLNNQTALSHPVHNKCMFQQLELGRQWHEFGAFDVVFCMSMYHHVYELCGSHEAVWLWLWRHTSELLIWEGPLDVDDVVVASNVGQERKQGYNPDSIKNAASRYFDIEAERPSGHEQTRIAMRCVPKILPEKRWLGDAINGSGGATAAFKHAGDRRICELSDILGVTPIAGSLNVALDQKFDWSHGFYRAKILDVVRRGEGLNTLWMPKALRLYPVKCNGVQAWAFRFESDSYAENFVELIADCRLRDFLEQDNRVDVVR